MLDKRGNDQEGMNQAVKLHGQVLGILADSLERAINRPSMRRAVISGHVSLVTAYTPAAPFSVGNAMGRNKVIYGLSRSTIVAPVTSGLAARGRAQPRLSRMATAASSHGPGREAVQAIVLWSTYTAPTSYRTCRLLPRYLRTRGYRHRPRTKGQVIS